MRMPGYLLRDRVTIRPFAGSGSFGDTFGAPVGPLKANVTPTRGVVAGPSGEEVALAAKAVMRPEDAETAAAGGTLTWKGTEYRIASSMPLTVRGAVATQLTLTPLGRGA